MVLETFRIYPLNHCKLETNFSLATWKYLLHVKMVVMQTIITIDKVTNDLDKQNSLTICHNCSFVPAMLNLVKSTEKYQLMIFKIPHALNIGLEQKFAALLYGGICDFSSFDTHTLKGLFMICVQIVNFKGFLYQGMLFYLQTKKNALQTAKDMHHI